MLFRLSASFLGFLSISACSAIDVGSGVNEVSELLVNRGGITINQSVLDKDDIATGNIYLKHLDRPFSLEKALQSTLIYSPKLRAHYARLKISKIDVEQASLPRNPQIDGVFTAGVTGEPSSLAMGVFFPVLDLIYRSIRLDETKAKFRLTQVRVAEDIMSHINLTSEAYLEVAKSQARIDALSNVLVVALSQAESARGLALTGGIDGSEVARLENISALAQIDLNQERNAKKIASLKLASLIGASKNQDLNVSLNIQEIGNSLISLESALMQAKKLRVDLAVAKEQVRLKEIMLKRARQNFGPESLEFGPEYEKEGSDGFLGLNVGIEVPIFDNGELKLEKAKAELSLAKHQLLVVENTIATQLRTAYADLSGKQKTAIAYRNKLVPFTNVQLKLAKQRFESGQIGALDFLRSEIAAARSQLTIVDAAANYWDALIRFNSAVGGWPQMK